MDVWLRTMDFFIVICYIFNIFFIIYNCTMCCKYEIKACLGVGIGGTVTIYIFTDYIEYYDTFRCELSILFRVCWL